MPKTGILIVNLGTPDQPDTGSVRRYLKAFLSDPRVIDLPFPIRWVLLHLFILPFRPKQSSKAYQQIWTDAGSPLLVNSQKLTQAIAEKLDATHQVTLGMRYGEPSISHALAQLKHCQEIKVLPLFPQYASATTGSVIEQVLQTLSHKHNIPSLSVVHAFYDHPKFITAYANVISNTLQDKSCEMLLFSYHGLPERHIKKSCSVMCNIKNACPSINETNQHCYRAQCYQTSRLLADALGLSKDQYQVVFQSRFNRTPWIQPYLNQTLVDLTKKGVKHIAIACPSFVADCLETLEEIRIRTTTQWRALGGENLICIPCLNANDDWAEAALAILHVGQR